MTKKPPVVAVIIPCYNEEEVLPLALEALGKVLEALVAAGLAAPTSHLLCVDDGSQDSTWPLIERWSADTSGRVQGLKLSRNFGHQAALLAGLFRGEYDISITIDADLQDPPEVVYQMVEEYARGGCDVVYGVRSDRDSDTFLKRTTAEGYYRLMRWCGVKLIFNHADCRLVSRRVTQELKQCKEQHIFLRGVIPSFGFPHATVTYSRAKRQAGEAKYTVVKLLQLAWDGATSQGSAPLTLVTICGFLVCAVAIALAAAMLLGHSPGATQAGMAALIVALYLVCGVSILCTGILGLYIGRIYQEMKGRPRFIIEKSTQRARPFELADDDEVANIGDMRRG